MIRNYINTIYRQLRNNLTFSLVNILGLSIGMAACLLISQYVFFHLSYDRDHQDHDKLFLVTSAVTRNGEGLGTGVMLGSLIGSAMIDNSPYVKALSRFWDINYMNNTLIHKGDSMVYSTEIDRVYLTDRSTFELFDIHFLAGGGKRFDEPLKMVLNEKTAIQYFENAETAIGQKMVLSGNTESNEYEVVGVIQNLPENTHLAFNVLLSYPSTRHYNDTDHSWVSNDNITYLKLNNPDDQESTSLILDEIFETHAGKHFEKYGYQFDLSLTNIKDIHLGISNHQLFKDGADALSVYALGVIAIIILMIAWINYLNMALVKTYERNKEVGIRKVLGASEKQVTKLFVYESIIVNMFSFVLAVTIIQIVAPFISEMTGFSYQVIQNNLIFGVMLLFILFGALLTGVYPAAILRTFNIVNLLAKRSYGPKGRKVGIRRMLVAVQFAITFFLVAGTVTVYKQITFMKKADLGINMEQIFVLKAPPGILHGNNDQYLNDYNALKDRLLGHTAIQDVVSAGELPGKPIGWGTSLRIENTHTDQSVDTKLYSMGLGLPEFLDMKLIAGRFLRAGDSPWSRGDVVVNEKLVEMLGYDNPEQALGEKLEGFYGDIPLEIRGVIQNHHHRSLHTDFEPIAYILSNWQEYFFVKFNRNQINGVEGLREAIATVEYEWDQVYIDQPMDYFFMDDNFNQQYAADEHFGTVFTSFSMLAILISCLGLFGLTTFILQRRTKEIGMRKVLGARLVDLFILLSQDYLVLLLISFIVAIPVAWYFLNEWLNEYKFNIEIGGWFIYTPLIIVLVIAVLTISIKIYQVASRNPVESLRYE